MEHKFVELTMKDGAVMLLNLDHVAACIKCSDETCNLVMNYNNEQGDVVVYHPEFPYAHMKLFLAPNLK